MTFSCPDCKTRLEGAVFIPRGLRCPKCEKEWPDPVIAFLEAWAAKVKAE